MRQIQEDLLSKAFILGLKAKTVLDIGCGRGAFTRALACLLPKAKVFGVEPQRRPPKNSTRFTYIRGAAECLPFPDNSFDLATACLSFHHWDNKEKGLKEVSRVLKPEGCLLLGDPFFKEEAQHKLSTWLLQKTDSGTFTSFEELENYRTKTDFTIRNISAVPRFFGMLFVIELRKTRKDERQYP